MNRCLRVHLLLTTTLLLGISGAQANQTSCTCNISKKAEWDALAKDTGECTGPHRGLWSWQGYKTKITADTISKEGDMKPMPQFPTPAVLRVLPGVQVTAQITGTATDEDVEDLIGGIKDQCEIGLCGVPKKRTVVNGSDYKVKCFDAGWVDGASQSWQAKRSGGGSVSFSVRNDLPLVGGFDWERSDGMVFGSAEARVFVPQVTCQWDNKANCSPPTGTEDVKYDVRPPTITASARWEAGKAMSSAEVISSGLRNADQAKGSIVKTGWRKIYVPDDVIGSKATFSMVSVSAPYKQRIYVDTLGSGEVTGQVKVSYDFGDDIKNENDSGVCSSMRPDQIYPITITLYERDQTLSSFLLHKELSVDKYAASLGDEGPPCLDGQNISVMSSSVMSMNSCTGLNFNSNARGEITPSFTAGTVEP